jgi:hypothetical protein
MSADERPGPQTTPWHVAGTYYEACNCDAICPCRRRGGLKLTTGSTYGICDFALSWRILDGAWGATPLAERSVVLAGSYSDAEAGKPWRVSLYIDDSATGAQHDALAEIFLGRAGGTALANYARAIGEVYAIRKARISLDHAPRRWFIGADDYVVVRGGAPVHSDLAITCGIPGHDQPGEELRPDVMRVADGALSWEVHGRCGYASRFDYRSDR